MIYLSKLLIDTGGNPDRPRPGRKWLDNIYNVHRRLSMAFPSGLRREQDPHFLKPFSPNDFQKTPFLFRVDNNIDGNDKRAIIIVQSVLEPDWDYCFQNALDFLAAPPETKEYNPEFQAGQLLRFRLRVNASVRRYIPEKVQQDGQTIETGNILHKRVSLTWDPSSTPDQALADWLAAKSPKLGFTLKRCELLQLGWVYGSKPEPKNVKAKEQGQGYWREHTYNPLRFRSALLEGILKVDDPKLFLETLRSGIGKAKSFGFGLLSVLPIRNDE